MECETGAQSHGVGVYGDGELGSAMGLACRENWGLACPAVGCEELGNKNAHRQEDWGAELGSWNAWSQGFGLAQSRVHGALISALSQPRASSSPRWSSVEGPEEKPPDIWEPQGRETRGRQGLRQCISSSCCVPKAPVLSPQPGGFCACVGGFSLVPGRKGSSSPF